MNTLLWGNLDNVLTGQSNRVDVFPVITEGHVLLAETYGVLALGDTIKDLEFFLRDALGIGDVSNGKRDSQHQG